MNLLKITAEPLESCNLLAVAGEVDLGSSPALRQAVEQRLEAGRPLLLDLTAVTFLDSFGIRILLGCAKTAETRGAKFTVIPSEAVARVLELTGVTPEIIDIAENLEAALRERTQ
ncbi:MAG TPA: STAS domain-containing protein [Actinospica sp.]|nr:STAS domain-containing protein [Actinospica sp.]